jgi:hypothetical protein
MKLPLSPLRMAHCRSTPNRLASVAAAVVGIVLASMTPARAAIDRGELGDGEMALVIWDPVREATYTLDLGWRMSEISADGQDDAGFQRFWKLDRDADPRLDKLLDLGSALSSLRWAVVATDADGFGFFPGDLRFFFTLEHTVPTGTLNPNYSNVLTLQNASLEAAITSVYSVQLFLTLNADASNPDNTHGTGGVENFDFNGSSFTAKGQAGYWEGPGQFMSTFASVSGPPITNSIGNSSWFYTATTSSAESTDPLTLDEFDNLTHDGFWGLTLDPADNTLALSYTIEGTGLTLAQRAFVQTIGRTEVDGGFAMRRLSGVATTPMEAGNGFSRRLLDLDDSSAPVSAVPEPSSWLLMGLGLGLVGWLARRRG